ncbi:Gamma-aminobutyric acid receptor subunit beta-like [Folsomia candida]|uniref:Gamma-aminobutyric acid receptor subunit beta-like n=1 Tax=Folsomia candida TaxID=158441 RepID=A0A226EXS6_FOLCA|nr:Gamma-aminobutyric acid receptor subunit beta-like [Folsomia candida]
MLKYFCVLLFICCGRSLGEISSPGHHHFLIPSSSEEDDSREAFVPNPSFLVANDSEVKNITRPTCEQMQASPVLLPPNYNKLDSKDFTYELLVDADLSLRWLDMRILEYYSDLNWTNPCTGKRMENFILDGDALKLIWKPDIFIDKLASVEKTSILSKLIQLEIITKQENDTRDDYGDVVYSARLNLKLRCFMDFTHYPADTQECLYYIRSYSYDNQILLLQWKKSNAYLEDPNDANFDIQLFDVEPTEKYSRINIEEKFDYYRQGNYSALRFGLKLRRNLSYHIVQTYLPSTLLILITWLCFLIPASMVEARIGISMTTLLTLTAMFASVREQSPKVSYTMAIDIHMVFCIFFVFIVLLLFTSTYWAKRRLTKKEQRIVDMDSDKVSLHVMASANVETYQRLVGFTQKYGFRVFSVTFISVVVTYWTWLLVASDYFNWNPSIKFNNLAGDEDGQGNERSSIWLRGNNILHLQEPPFNYTFPQDD